MIRLLYQINKKFEFNNFYVKIRFVDHLGSKSNSTFDPEFHEETTSFDVWDESYIHDELFPFIGKIKKIIICGPPLLN